jgi:hypothetical protein
MFSYDWILPQSLPLCLYADRFYRTARDTLFSRLSDTTSAEQFEQSHATLLQMKEDIEKDMPAVHYAAQFGSHVCVADLFDEASLRLRGLALLQPPEAADPPAPDQAPLTYEELLLLLQKLLPQTLTLAKNDKEDEQ